MWVLCYIPYTGLAVFSYAISRVPVYTAISIPCEFVANRSQLYLLAHLISHGQKNLLSSELDCFIKQFITPV